MNQDIQTSHAVVAEGLGKRYGEQWALRDFDLAVPTGSVLGLLGHNGAGKTTAIRILTTLASPTAGSAKVAGHDVVTEPDRGPRTDRADQPGGDRRRADERRRQPRDDRPPLPPAAQGRPRAGDELLAELQLEDAGDRLVRTTAAACAGGSTSPPAWSPRPRSSSSTSRPPASTRKAATSSGTCCASWSAAAPR